MIKIILIITAMLIIFIIIQNNITPNYLGVTDGKLEMLNNKDNSVSSQTDDKGKYVEPLNYIGSVQESKDRIINIFSSYEGCKVVVVKDDYIHAVFESEFFRFKDDVEIYFSDVIHYRSESRVGLSDMGVNKKRYDDIRNSYYNE